MRKIVMAGNWKMNMTPAQAVVLMNKLSYSLEKDELEDVDVVVCPPATDLGSAYRVIEFEKLQIALGAQNVHWEQSGAFTGEVSIPMIKDCGCTYCIVGHSERREMFCETDGDVNRKVKALVAAGLAPIVCVGESLSIRDSGTAVEYVSRQVKADLAGLDPDEAAKCLIAYEPIWAIGTGRSATPEQAQQICAAIRAQVADMFGDDIAEGMRVLYGGSMNVGNVDTLIAKPDIDGGLVGGCSLKPEDFSKLVKAAVACHK